MKPALWFRAAAVFFLLFAASHTVGFLTFRAPTAEGQAVWRSMNQVTFTVGKSTFSYGRFYLGFGLFISLFDVFQAFLSWFLGALAREGSRQTRPIAWTFCAVQLIGAALAWQYFSTIPFVLSLITAAILAAGAIQSRAQATP